MNILDFKQHVITVGYVTHNETVGKENKPRITVASGTEKTNFTLRAPQWQAASYPIGKVLRIESIIGKLDDGGIYQSAQSIKVLGDVDHLESIKVDAEGNPAKTSK